MGIGVQIRLGGSDFDVADEVGLVESQQHFFGKHEIKSFMLYMGIGKYVLVVSVKHSSQNLPVYLVLAVDLLVLLVYSEELDHVETGFRLV